MRVLEEHRFEGTRLQSRKAFVLKGRDFSPAVRVAE